MALNSSIRRITGATLIELIVSLPIFAILTISIGYHLSVATKTTEAQIAQMKCSLAAHNLLSLLQAASSTPPLTAINSYLSGAEIKKSCPAHPDGFLSLTVDTTGSNSTAFNLKVSSSAFGVSAEVHTFFPNM
ncbi:MAG: type II secretion system protein [Candidatus Riflebacteria bacterium]|nr:type II secretion system protein [Candidatus Riflebacteria bacterium]